MPDAVFWLGLGGVWVGFLAAGGYGLIRMLAHAVRHEGDVQWLVPWIGR